MRRTDELRLMAKVARMYYEHGLRQSDIAVRLHLSQATVSRLLKRARRENIVRISVHIPRGAYVEWEEQLQSIYGLQEAVIADCDDDNERSILESIGRAAAFYLESTIDQSEVIGISSWSETLLAMVDAMRPLTRPIGARVVQILGGIGNPNAEKHASRLVNRLAELLHGTAILLPAPGVVGSAESRQVLLNDPFTREAMDMFEEITLALVGIGSVEPSKLLSASGNVFDRSELDKLSERGAVGDMLLRFIDSEGRRIMSELDQRVIGMDLEQLRNVSRVVGVAGGERKVPAIKGVLKGRWINVLITDRFTAERLLDR